MKILFLTNVPSPYRVAFFKEWGKQVSLTVLYEKATADDRDASWIVDEVKKTQEKDRTDDNIPEENGYFPVLLSSMGHGADKAFCPSVTRYLKDQSYDRIVVGVYSNPTGMYAIWYMRSHGIPFWISIDGGFAPKSENLFLAKLKTYLLSGAQGYIASGHFCRDYLLHYRAKEERIFYFSFSSIWEKDIADKCLTGEEKLVLRSDIIEIVDKQKPVLLYVGQLIPRKGIDILLKAAKLLEDSCTVLLVGGEPPTEYSELQERLGLKNVVFLPFTSGEALNKLYRLADLFVLPTREDIWGLVVGEAQAAGLPVITTTNCGAGLELVNEQNGALVEPDDERALADAIRSFLLLEEKDRLRLGENALKKAHEYTVETMAASYQRVLNR